MGALKDGGNGLPLLKFDRIREGFEMVEVQDLSLANSLLSGSSSEVCSSKSDVERRIQLLEQELQGKVAGLHRLYEEKARLIRSSWELCGGAQQEDKKDH